MSLTDPPDKKQARKRNPQDPHALAQANHAYPGADTRTLNDLIRAHDKRLIAQIIAARQPVTNRELRAAVSVGLRGPFDLALGELLAEGLVALGNATVGTPTYVWVTS